MRMESFVAASYSLRLRLSKRALERGDNEARQKRDYVAGHCFEDDATSYTWPQWLVEKEWERRKQGELKRNVHLHFRTCVPTFCNLAAKSSDILRRASIIERLEISYVETTRQEQPKEHCSRQRARIQDKSANSQAARVRVRIPGRIERDVHVVCMNALGWRGRWGWWCRCRGHDRVL